MKLAMERLKLVLSIHRGGHHGGWHEGTRGAFDRRERVTRQLVRTSGGLGQPPKSVYRDAVAGRSECSETTRQSYRRVGEP